MIIQIYGSKSAVNRCFEPSRSFPKGLAPLYFSENEVDRNKTDNKVENATEFEKFKNENKLGYFLHSEYATVSIGHEEGQSSVFIDIKNRKAIPTIEKFMECLSIEGIDYGMACEWSEWRYRNGMVKVIGKSTIENWVGRDHTRYLPGLYWLNLIPKSMFSKFQIETENVVGLAYEAKELADQFMLIMMFDRPQNWKDYAEGLDTLCEKESGVFSKWTVWDQLQLTSSQDEYFHECRKYP